MTEHLMETTWRTALWKQFGAAIDMLENALLSCPDSLWRERLWRPPSDGSLLPWIPAAFSEFWYIAYHTLFWLDLYLSGLPEEDFTPPAPFLWTEGNPAVSPEQPYTKEELLTYLATMRRKCHTTLLAQTDEHAHQTTSSYPWTGEQGASFLEILLYTMRHVQEHAAQLLLFLGQHGIQGEALNTVARAKDGADH
jgi:hypothetical protein